MSAAGAASSKHDRSPHPLPTVSAGSPPVNTCGGQPPLCGRYKECFRPECHPVVSKWYHQDADHKQRQNFKRFVKAITHFDVAEAKKSLRVGFDLDIPNANAIVKTNCGELMTDAAREKAVYFVATASQADRQAYRETVGMILPPSLTCLHKSKQHLDYDEDRKYMKGELMLRDTSKKVVGVKELRPRSFPVDAPCDVIGDGKSQYGLFYAWKVAPKLGVNVTQRAHEASYHGAPWGQYGSSEKSRWKTHCKEDMEDREYGAPTTTMETTAMNPSMSLATTKMPKRRFQNYNDNVTHEMYRTQRLIRKGRALPGDTVVQAEQVARAAPDLMSAWRTPIHPGESTSPIFCR